MAVLMAARSWSGKFRTMTVLEDGNQVHQATRMVAQPVVWLVLLALLVRSGLGAAEKLLRFGAGQPPDWPFSAGAARWSRCVLLLRYPTADWIDLARCRRRGRSATCRPARAAPR